MPLKRMLALALVVCFSTAPLWAQTASSLLSDYVGKTTAELMAAEGTPILRVEDPPFLTFVYPDKIQQGRLYDVAYSVLGNQVVSLRYNINPDFVSQASHFNPGRGFGDYLCKSGTEIMALEGPPMAHFYYPDQRFAQLSYEKIDIGGKLYDIIYEFEDDVVINIAYHYEGVMPGDKIRPFVFGMDAKLMKGLDKPVWILGDSDDDPPPDNVWRLLRMISGGPFNIVLVAMADLTQNSLVVDLSIQNRQGQGPRAILFAGEHELRLMELSQYVPHSANINTLLEITDDE